MRRFITFVGAALLATGLVVSAVPGIASAHRGHSHKAEAHATRDARFTATGTLVSVDSLSRTLVVTVDGGNRKALHGTDTTFVVALDASIEKDALPATLDDLLAGDHVMVKGAQQADGTWLAGKVRATSPEVIVEPVV